MLPEPFHYGYAPYAGRPRIVWPGGRQLAFWVIPNIEHYEFAPPHSPMRGAPWPRPLPDILNYSHREYGNRVGFHRVAEVMARHGVRGTVSLNVAVCEHFPEIIETTNRLGWELMSHGVYNTRYLYDLDEDEQRAVIRDCRETILRHSGQRLDGWLSPAISNTETTQHVLAEEGIRYTIDLYHDDQPTPVRVRGGQRLVSVPYHMEINDTPVMQFRGIGPAEWLRMATAQFDQLYAEGAESGTVLCLPLHGYLMGQPHRIRALSALLAHVTAHEGVWLATGREIAAWFETHYYDAFERFADPVAA